MDSLPLKKLYSSFLLQALVVSFGVGILCLVALTIARLYLSPIAHILGPKLAKITWWYELWFYRSHMPLLTCLGTSSTTMWSRAANSPSKSRSYTSNTG